MNLCPLAPPKLRLYIIIIIIIISNLSKDRSKASCKTVPPHSAIYSVLLQFTVSSPDLKVVPVTSYVYFLVFLSLLSVPLFFRQ